MRREIDLRRVTINHMPPNDDDNGIDRAALSPGAPVMTRTVVTLAPMLRLALQTGSRSAVDARIRSGDALEGRDTAGRTPLMIAALRGQRDICLLLQVAGADTRAIDPAGRTAATLAREAGHVDLAMLLMPSDHRGRTNPDGRTEPVQLEASDAPDDGMTSPVAGPGEGFGRVPAPPAARESIPAVPVDAMDCRLQPSAAASRGDDGLPTMKSATGEDNGDPMDDWVAVDDTVLSRSAGDLVDAASRVHAVMESHRPRSDDEEWREVELTLPAIPSSHSSAKLDSESRAGLRSVIAFALDRRLVGESELVEAISGTAGPANDYEATLVRHLLLCLADAGVHVGDLPPGRLIPTDPADWTDPSQRDVTDVEDIADCIEDAASGRDDPFWQWARDLRLAGTLLSHQEEIDLGNAIKEGLRSAVHALLDDPHSSNLLRNLIEDGAAARLSSTSVAQGEDDVVDEESELQVEPNDTQAAPSLSVPPLGVCLEAFRRSPGSQSDTRAETWIDAWLEKAGCGLVQLCRLRDRSAAEGLHPNILSRLDRSLAGANRARDRFTKSNLRLVWSIARRYTRAGVPLNDLIQDGCIGLMRAVDRFDPDRGFRFSTYATWWIRQSVSRAVADKSRLIRVPVHMFERMQHVDRAVRALRARQSGEPSIDEIASATHLSATEVAKVLRAARDVVSMDSPEGESWETRTDASLPDPELPEDALSAQERRDLVVRTLAGMKRKDALVIAMRFGIGSHREHTLEEVGRALELTRERIRQIERKALLILTARLKAELTAPIPKPSGDASPRDGDRHAFQGSPTGQSRARHPAVQQVLAADPESSDPVAASWSLQDVLRMLASREEQGDFAARVDVPSLQREFSRLWFEAYSPSALFTAGQHAALHQLTAAIRSALRKLGFGWVPLGELHADETWLAVIAAASEALEMLEDK